jgi:hypothetical protein
MFSRLLGFFKRTPEADFDAPLSPEADQFLAAATEEFNRKQKALQNTWNFGSAVQWGYDQLSGVLRLSFPDGSQFEAEGQCLGSYCPGDGTWEWAWDNPNVDGKVAKDSHKVRELGDRLQISYLRIGTIPLPEPRMVSYLCAIGIKATNSIGVYQGEAGPIQVFIMLKRPRRV